jgi:hypothetical protein
VIAQSGIRQTIFLKEGCKMKSHNAFWTAIALLGALSIGACSLEMAQHEAPATEQSSEAPQEEAKK